ncbi:TonB family protein [Erwinia persicina]|uniref:TonB family protein n=1 Tax=Erwinia persicina TaxID=55211 RepID=UPI00178675B5|nr:TonB family protein [Erwinia persicina]MBD8168626.1 TonB family protein [Erwinia persicina]
MKYLIAVFFSFLMLGCSQQNHNVTYPDHANMLRIGGTVTISYNVNSQGMTEDVRVLNADPSGVFEKTLLNDVRGWRFEKGNPLRDQIITVNYGQNK